MNEKNKNKPIPVINLESLPNHSFLSLYYGDKKNTMPKLKKTSKEKLTFCVSACNNLNYLKLLIYSVRKYAYYKTAPFIVFAEHCIDGTNEWLNDNKEQYNLTIIENNNKDIICGISGGMNVCANMAATEYIMFLHADYFVGPNFDKACMDIFEKYPNQKLWVNPYRFQPNCHNELDRPGISFLDYDAFGYTHTNFLKEDFIQYAEEFSNLNVGVEYNKGEGVSGLINTNHYYNIGGNDTQFIAYYDDVDIFLRCQLDGFKFVLTTNGVVWHFGSRSDKSNFPTDDIIRSEKSKQYENDSHQKFINKWGFMPSYNEHGFVTLPYNINPNNFKHLIHC